MFVQNTVFDALSAPTSPYADVALRPHSFIKVRGMKDAEEKYLRRSVSIKPATKSTEKLTL